MDSRNQRAKAIRDARGETQDVFALALNRIADRFGLSVRYNGSKVAKIETGKRDVSLDDALIFAELDPAARGVAWLAGVPTSPGAAHADDASDAEPYPDPVKWNGTGARVVEEPAADAEAEAPPSKQRGRGRAG